MDDYRTNNKIKKDRAYKRPYPSSPLFIYSNYERVAVYISPKAGSVTSTLYWAWAATATPGGLGNTDGDWINCTNPPLSIGIWTVLKQDLSAPGALWASIIELPSTNAPFPDVFKPVLFSTTSSRLRRERNQS